MSGGRLAIRGCVLLLPPFLMVTLIAAGNGPAEGEEPESREVSEATAPEPFAVPPGLQSSGSSASSDKWQVAITPYLFLARLDGRVSLGGLENDISVPASTLLDNLEFAAASRFEVGKGPWAGLFDIYFLALGDQGDLPLGGRLDVDIDMLIFESALAYRLGSPKTGVDVLGGVRYSARI